MSSTYYDQSYPPYLWTNPDKGTASDDDSFTEPTITAQDSVNAAKLGPLGYVAVPQTAWVTGNGIYVNTSFRFYWTGTAWSAGLAPVADESNEPPPPPPEPEEPEPEPETYSAIPIAPEDMPEATEEA